MNRAKGDVYKLAKNKQTNKQTRTTTTTKQKPPKKETNISNTDRIS